MNLMFGKAATGLLFLVGLALAAPASAAALPEPVRAMIAKAAEGDDPTVLAAVVSVARQTNPEAAAEIDALAARPAATAATDAGEPAVLAVAAAPAPAPPPWKGSVELGGSVAQGSTESLGAYGAIDLSRAGPAWSHRFDFRGDYQQTGGRTSARRFSLAYEPRLRLTPALYSFGLAQYESNRFLGFRSRYTLGAGVGVQVADRSDLKIALDLGPALRLNDPDAAAAEEAVAGRASLNVRWLPTDRITVSQETAVYAEEAQASAKSITAMESLLFGPLKARLSYNLQYERDTRLSRSGLDTTTRASLLYTF